MPAKAATSGGGAHAIIGTIEQVGIADAADRRVKGWTSVTLRATERLSSFDLDFLLPVSAVHLSTGPAAFGRPTRHELRITPQHSIASGTTVRVRVVYAGHPSDITWHGEHNWVADRHEVVAVNEPHMAPWWFPSNDHPLDKARMDLHLTVPGRDQVVSNGRRAAWIELRRFGGPSPPYNSAISSALTTSGTKAPL